MKRSLAKWLGLIALLPLIYNACGLFSSNQSADTTVVPPNDSSQSVYPQLRLEPAQSIVIGSGQVQPLFVTYKETASDPFPIYLKETEVTVDITDSNVVFATRSNGNVLLNGVAQGETAVVVTARGRVERLVVKVAGQMSQHSVLVNGQGLRAFSVYDPDPSQGAVARPLLFSWHGGGGSAAISAATNRLVQLASQRNFVVLFPNGSGVIQTFNAGNCCGSAASQNVDDLNYFDRLMQAIGSLKSVNPNRVYSAGFSNGAMMSYRLACARSSVIKGIIAVGAGSGELDRLGGRYYTCDNPNPVRVLQFHSVNDRNYPIDGGYGDGFSNSEFLSIDASVGLWISRNGLTRANPIITQPAPNVSCSTYQIDPSVSLPGPRQPVQYCIHSPIDVFDQTTGIVFGGGHSWPGGVRSVSTSSDTPDPSFDFNTFAWEFLGF